MPNPKTLPAWQSLTQLAKSAPTATESAVAPITAAGIYVDFSRQSIDAATRNALIALAREAGVEAKRDAMFAGEVINTTEKRPVLHTASRAGSATPLMVNGRDVRPSIRAQLAAVETFSAAVRSGKVRSATDQKFTDVVNLGIGGSLLGPELVCGALARFCDGPRVHFVSNVDGAHLDDVLAKLNCATTLFTVTSKTFTTDETMTNARSAIAWVTSHLGGDAVAKQFVAVTAAPAQAKKNGYPDDRIFEFDDWVGGRFSLWSSVGLPIALACGAEVFKSLLNGAEAMDTHFREAPIASNLPMMLGLIGVWNRNFLGYAAHAVLPYSQRLGLLPNHLQQLEMESNGKSVDMQGTRIDYSTCPIIFGQSGTNGQHSFHQLLHQGTDISSNDILVLAEADSRLKEHHEKLVANAIAQADAFWHGKSFDTLFAELQTKIADAETRRQLAEHRTHPGRRPVAMFILPRLDAYHLGALIALYEHKVLVQGAIWNVNSFDQWGVELGKVIAQGLLPAMTPATRNQANTPAHLAGFLAQLDAMSASATNK
jgi:glucose-6-phosphate isomerase